MQHWYGLELSATEIEINILHFQIQLTTLSQSSRTGAEISYDNAITESFNGSGNQE